MQSRPENYEYDRAEDEGRGVSPQKMLEEKKKQRMRQIIEDLPCTSMNLQREHREQRGGRVEGCVADRGGEVEGCV